MPPRSRQGPGFLCLLFRENSSKSACCAVAGQGVEVGVSFLLENEAEIARIIAQSGGKIGKDFSDKLSAEGKKAFDQLVSSAEKAAQEVGAKFSKTDLRFRNNLGQFLTPKELEALAAANKSFKEAVDGVNKFRNAVEGAARSSERSFNLIEAAVEGVAISLTSRLTDAITTSLGGVKNLVSGFLDLDGELRLAAAAAGETGGYERLGAIVDKVGIEAAGTTKEVAQLATALTRAGFTVKEIETALPGVVRGAEATGTSFASFGDIVGNTLRGFGLEVEETARVVDVLVNTANSSNASIEGLGYTFEYTAPIAKALGVSLEEVAAAAGLMANAGIQGSVAGTGLRTGLQKLQQAAGGASPEVLGLARGQERLSGIMRKLGADVVDANGKLLPMERVLISLKNSLSKLNQGDQVQLSTVLFGEEAGPKWLSILNQTDTAITKMFRDIGNSSGSADTARTAMSGMGLELRQLEGTLQSLGTQFGGIIAAGLRPFVALANTAAGAISGMPGPVKTTAGALLALTVAATAATVALAATRAVVAQIGFSSLAAGAAAAGRSIMSMGAGTTVILGIAGALALVSPAFRETDRTTKQLLQTTIALGVGIAIFRGLYQGLKLIEVAQSGINNITKAYAVILSFVKGLNPGSALLALGIAAAAATGAYFALDNVIKVTGADTEELSSKANDLKEQIKGVQEEIANSKKLNLDTSEAQRKLDDLQAQLQKVETPLELKIDIQKIEAQIRDLEGKLSRLSADAPQRGPIEAELAARRSFLEVLKAADQGAGADRVKEMSKASQEIVKQTAAFRDEIDRLNKQKITLPANAAAQRNAIDERIAGLQQILSRKTEREQLELVNREIQKKIQLTKTELAETEKAQKLAGSSVSPVFGIANPNADVSPVRSQADLQSKIKSLKREEQLLTQSLVTNQLALESSAKKQERTARGIVQTAKDRLEIAKAKLDTEQMSIESLDKQFGIETKRLSLVREIADAYSGLLNAQTALTQSKFDVLSSRNNREITEAETLLQSLKDREASASQIETVEQRIAYLKRQAQDIEYNAMSAAIEAAEKRFEMERKILELKQRSQIIEQQGAIRTAESNVLQQRQRLLDLEVKKEDPSVTPGQKAIISNQIDIQKQSIDLARQQVAAERQRANSLELIQSLERGTLDAQQQTAVNQQRAAAASKGFEFGLSDQLRKLDDSLSKNRQITYDLNNQKDIIKSINDLLDERKKITGSASVAPLALPPSSNLSLGVTPGNIQPPRTSSSPFNQDLPAPMGMGWNEIPNGGIIDLKVEGVPKHINDAFLRQARRDVGRVFERQLPDGRTEYYNSRAVRASISTQGESLETRRRNERKLFAESGLKAGEMNLANSDEILIENWMRSQLRNKRGMDDMKSQAKSVSSEVSDMADNIKKATTAIEDDFSIQNWKDYQDNLSKINDIYAGVTGNTDELGRIVQTGISDKNFTAIYDSLLNVTEQAGKATRQAQDLKDAYSSLGDGLTNSFNPNQQGPDIINSTKAAVEETKDLKNEWQSVFDVIDQSAKTLKVFAAPTQARFAGGNVEPGRSYQINELGQESWLDEAGRLRLITAPAYSTWSPPSKGLVLPANVTASLRQRGAFDGPSPALASMAPGGHTATSVDASNLAAVVGRLERRMIGLEDAMRTYRPMDVTIKTPSSAGQIQAMRGVM